MRKPIEVLLLFACLLPFVYGQKTRLSQRSPTSKPLVVYPFKVHISAIHIRPSCEGAGCGNEIYADAVVNEKKLELRGNIQKFSTGDYQARLKNNLSNADPTELGALYDLVFQDGTVWRCTVVGISE